MFLSRPTQLAASSAPIIAGRNSARNNVAIAIDITRPIIIFMVLLAVPFSITVRVIVLL